MDRTSKNEVRYIWLDSETYLEAFSSLLDRGFNVEEGQHFLDDFPVWNSKLNPTARRAGAFQGDRLVGTLAIRNSTLHTSRGSLSVMVLGGVVTDKNFRGEGIASRLIEMGIKAAEGDRVDAIFLWGSEHELYRKFGFELCGEQVRIKVKDLIESEKPSQTMASSGWDSDIFSSLQKRPVGLALEESDRPWFERHLNVKWRSLSDGRELNYIGFNRGIDLKGIVHEWGGTRQGVLGLLSAALKEEPSLEMIGSPELFQKKRFSYYEDQVEFLCMAKIVNFERTLEKMGISNQVDAKKEKNGNWNLKIGKVQLSHLNELDLVRLTFGPSSFLKGIPEFPIHVLPIPIWIWGLDSG